MGPPRVFVRPGLQPQPVSPSSPGSTAGAQLPGAVPTPVLPIQKSFQGAFMQQCAQAQLQHQHFTPSVYKRLPSSPQESRSLEASSSGESMPESPAVRPTGTQEARSTIIVEYHRVSYESQYMYHRTVNCGEFFNENLDRHKDNFKLGVTSAHCQRFWSDILAHVEHEMSRREQVEASQKKYQTGALQIWRKVERKGELGGHTITSTEWEFVDVEPIEVPHQWRQNLGERARRHMVGALGLPANEITTSTESCVWRAVTHVPRLSDPVANVSIEELRARLTGLETDLQALIAALRPVLSNMPATQPCPVQLW
ncbi:unnamed protein product [Symbiodinium natans]|uniref:Uncharacterized protein n=1 Tax=Symbiodinium natans TaxID=878477 RepID=A0A812IK06_9DINO|nr:unnamed protein product [Symbiodinium natans]